MNLTDVTGGAKPVGAPASAQASAMTAHQATPTPRPAGPGTGDGPKGPVDSVRLSAEATKALNGALSFTVPTGDGGNAPAADRPAGPALVDPAMMVRAQERSDYMQRLGAIVRETFGIPDDMSWMVGGAGFAMLDSLAAANGLTKPDEDKEDPFADDAASRTGVFGLSVTDVNSPNFGVRMTIAFDRGTDIPPDRLRLAAVTAGETGPASLLASLKGGSLSRFIDGLGAGQAEDGASLFAITDDGAGPNARIAGAVQSYGMDELAASSAVDMLKTIRRLLPQ